MSAPLDTLLPAKRRAVETESATDAFLAMQNAGAAESAAPAPAAPDASGSADPGTFFGNRARDVAGGVVDALSNLDQSARDFAVAIGKKTGIKLGGIGYDPERGFHYATPEEIEANSDPEHSLVQKLIPDVPKGNTFVANATRGIAQFTTGLLIAKRLPGLGALGATGSTGAYASTAIAGAIAQGVAFDPHAARLSNLVEQFPRLRNPVTSFLQAKPGDSGAEGRFKNALEGLGLGIGVDAFVKGVKLVRAGILAKTATTAAEGTEGGAKGAVDGANQLLGQLRDAKDELTSLVGNADEPLLQTRAVDEALQGPEAAKAVAHASGQGGDVFVNWARINTPDDVKAVIQDLADAGAEGISTAARGKRSWTMTRLSAEQENAWQLLAERRAGEPLNAEQSLAVRELWVRSGSKLQELARAVTADPGSEAKQIAFNKLMAIHVAVQEQVLAARTETARALNAWKIPAGEGADLLGQFDALKTLTQARGTSTVEIAAKVRALGDAGFVGETDTFLRRVLSEQSAHAVKQWFYFSALSRPVTHMRNLIGTSMNLGMEVLERRGAAWIGKALGDQHVADEEAAVMLASAPQSFRDAFRLSARTGEILDAMDGQAAAAGAAGDLAKTARGGMGGFWRVLGGGESSFGAGAKVGDVLQGGDFAAERFALDPASMQGRAFEALDAITTVPRKLLAATDEVTSGVAFNSEMQALATRQAMQEVRSGVIAKEAASDRVAQLLTNDDDVMRLGAQLFARRATLNDPLPSTNLAQALARLSRVPILGQLTVPFPRITYMTQREFLKRTPAALFSKGFYAELAKGGAARDIALSKLALGSALLAGLADLGLSNFVTGRGPQDPRARASLEAMGWQPYSVKVPVGDGQYRYFSLRGLEPISSAVAFAGDLGELLRYTDWSDPNKEIQDLGTQSMFALATQMTAGPFVQGMSNFFDAMSDPQRYGTKFFERTVAGLAVPGIVSAWEPALDPTMRDVYSTLDAIKAKTPGLSKDLPARLDIWGREVSAASGFGGLYDAISPIASRGQHMAPIDRELERLGHYVGKPARSQSFQGITLNMTQFPKEYEELTKLSGAPAFEALNDIVSQPGYQALSDGPDGGKAALIDSVLARYRDAAKEQLFANSPEIQAEVLTRLSQKAQ